MSNDFSPYVDEIDVERVRELAEQIASALDDPGRVAAFDAMLARARNASR